MHKISILASSIVISQLLAGLAEAAVCTPIDVAQIDSRIHIHCEQPIADGTSTISWFALPTTGSGDEARTASRFLAVGMLAVVTGKQMSFWFIPGDTSGASYGCGASDCRKPTGFSLVK